MTDVCLWSVAKHVGRYGEPGGDIIATGNLRVFRPNEEPESTGFYATVAVFGSREEALDYVQRKTMERIK